MTWHMGGEDPGVWLAKTSGRKDLAVHHRGTARMGMQGCMQSAPLQAVAGTEGSRSTDWEHADAVFLDSTPYRSLLQVDEPGPAEVPLHPSPKGHSQMNTGEEKSFSTTSCSKSHQHRQVAV